MIIICLLLLGTDASLKWYTHQYLPMMNWAHPFYPYGGIPVFQDWCGIDLSLNYVMNRGAAWGMLASFQQELLYARFFLVGALIVYIIMSALSWTKRLGFLLILTGAVGNIIDYFLYHHVVDMLHFRLWGYTFPVFNIADSLIFCGAVLLLLGSALKKRALHSS